MDAVPQVDLNIATLAGSMHDAALFQQELRSVPPSEWKALREAYHDALKADRTLVKQEWRAGLQTAILDGVLAQATANDPEPEVATNAAPLPSRSDDDAQAVYRADVVAEERARHQVA